MRIRITITQEFVLDDDSFYMTEPEYRDMDKNDLPEIFGDALNDAVHDWQNWKIEELP